MKESPSLPSRAFAPSIEPLEARIAPAFAAVVNLSTLNGTNGFKIQGEAAGNQSGYSVSGAGDVNGDGFADLLIGALFASPNGADSGASYVVFGKAGGFTTPVNLSTLDGTNGFKIQGEAAGDSAGLALSGAGDVNGDGFADLLIGASLADPNGTNSGANYVVFGKAGGFAPILNLSTLNGANGFKIQGEAAGDFSGLRLSGAGDINGDGFADLIIGAPGASPNGTGSGASYVVFGKAGGFAPILNLSTLNGTNGFKIQGEAQGDSAGERVSGAGDVNGDGFADLLIGAAGASPNGTNSGASYVVFGKAGGFAPILNLSTLNGTNGFKIQGEAQGDSAGASVSGAGDVNGDGFADLLIGAPNASPNGAKSGASYVVFGKADGFTTPLNLSTLDGTNGFKIPGEAAGDQSGYSVSGAGDINGDGFADLLIGAPYASPNGANSGASYVVFGRADGFTTPLNLSTLDGTNGFKIQGEAAGDSAGICVSAAGDVNGDGFADLLIGAAGASPNGTESGASYVIFGQPDVKVTFSTDHKTGTFLDTDGDLVTVKVSKGALIQSDFTFSGGVWQKLDLSGNPLLFDGTNLTVKVKKGLGGDGTVNLGAIDAHGVDLGSIALPGDLGQIDAGDGNVKLPAVKALTVGSLGAVAGTQPVGTTDPLESDIDGTLAKLTVIHDDKGVINVTGGTGAKIGTVSIGGNLDGSAGGDLAGLLRAGSDIGPVTVKGSVIGGADFSGIIAGGKLGKVSIGAALISANAAEPVTISALGKLGATKAADAVAIAGLSVKTNVLNAEILAGYTASLGAANPDAGIGVVTVGGNWSASSMAAGVADSTGDGFGRNDTLIGGDATPTLFARIASITIKGTATGSATPTTDFYGITAQQIGALAIGTKKFTFTNTANDFSLDLTNNDFHAVDFA